MKFRKIYDASKSNITLEIIRYCNREVNPNSIVRLKIICQQNVTEQKPNRRYKIIESEILQKIRAIEAKRISNRQFFSTPRTNLFNTGTFLTLQRISKVCVQQ